MAKYGPTIDAVDRAIDETAAQAKAQFEVSVIDSDLAKRVKTGMPLVPPAVGQYLLATDPEFAETWKRAARLESNRRPNPWAPLREKELKREREEIRTGVAAIEAEVELRALDDAQATAEEQRASMLDTIRSRLKGESA